MIFFFAYLNRYLVYIYSFLYDNDDDDDDDDDDDIIGEYIIVMNNY